MGKICPNRSEVISERVWRKWYWVGPLWVLPAGACPGVVFSRDWSMQELRQKASRLSFVTAVTQNVSFSAHFGRFAFGIRRFSVLV